MHPKLYSKGNKSKKMDLFSKGLQATVHFSNVEFGNIWTSTKNLAQFITLVAK